MNCKRCGFFRELSPDEIIKDLQSGNAQKYKCMKSDIRYTEDQLIEQEKSRYFCSLKSENRTGKYLAIASIVITSLFGAFGLLPMLTSYQTKEDVINILNDNAKSQDIYLKGDTLFITNSNSFVVIDSFFISKSLKQGNNVHYNEQKK